MRQLNTFSNMLYAGWVNGCLKENIKIIFLIGVAAFIDWMKSPPDIKFFCACMAIIASLLGYHAIALGFVVLMNFGPLLTRWLKRIRVSLLGRE